MHQLVTRTAIEKKFLDLCFSVVGPLGLEVYDLDYISGNSTLRIFIQNPDTKSAVLEDCMKVDKALTEHIECLDWMPEELTLEVSSPGMFRGLRELKHFEQAVEQMIELVLLKSLDQAGEESVSRKLKGQKKIRVLLSGVTDEYLEIIDEENKIKVNFNIIKKATLSPPWN